MKPWERYQAQSQGGQLEAGNIDLNRRPVVRNSDGSISTVRSMSVGMDGREYLIPTVSDDGRVMGEEEAIEQFRRSGHHLGAFDTPEAATRYAQQLHEQQATQYQPVGAGRPWERFQQQVASHSQQASGAGQTQRAPLERPQDFAGLPGFEDVESQPSGSPAPRAQTEVTLAPARSDVRVNGVGRAARRGFGLAARTVIEGAGAIPIALTDAAGRLALGDNYQPVRETLTAAGLPEPATQAERMVSAVGEGGGAALTGVGVGNVLLRASSPSARAAGGFLAENPLAQLVAGASSGGASQVTAEHTDNPLLQLLAGVAAGTAAGAIALPRGGAVPLRNIEPRGPVPVNPAVPVADAPAGAVTTAAGAQGLRSQASQLEALAQRAAAEAGLEWGSLDDALRARVMRAMQTSDLPPEAAARAAFYQSLGLTPTRGMATRSLVDTQAEGVAKKSGFDESEPLRQIDASNNVVFRQRIQDLAPEGVKAVDLPTFGQQFRDDLAQGAQRSRQVRSDFYTRARQQEGANEAPVDDLFAYMQANRSRLATSQAGAPVIAYLRDVGLWTRETADAFRKGEPVSLPRNLTLNELTDLRSMINNAAGSTTDRNAQGLLTGMRRILDDAESAAGGEATGQARRVFARQASVWEGNPLLVKLLQDKRGFRGVDQIPDEEVFRQAVINSSNDDFKAVWFRASGPQKDLTRAQLAKHIEEHTFSNMGRNELADPIASAAKLSRVITSINPQKLQMIYGKDKARQLNSLNKALVEIANPPAGSVPTGSAPALVQIADRYGKVLQAVGRIFGFGSNVVNDMAGGLVGAARSGAKNRENAQAVNQAMNLNRQSMQSGQANNRLLQLLAPAAAGVAVAGE